jgi:lysine 2,3-aminomutase
MIRFASEMFAEQLDPIPPAEPPSHQNLIEAPDWRQFPAWQDVSSLEFHDWLWQARNTVTKPSQLAQLLGDRVDQSFIDDVLHALGRVPMSIRISPYVLSLINWDNPYDDPIRIQFIPVGSRLLPDHPCIGLDSLHEQKNSPVPGLVHRYPGKALFLPLDTCPVYCRFCTRSYAVGIDTEMVDKVSLKVSPERWKRAYTYLTDHPDVEDVVVSGGDTYQLKADQILEIGNALLSIQSIRRMRFATKGLAVMPSKILTDASWTGALTQVADTGRRRGVEVSLHTHFNHPSEITQVTQRATQLLFERGITVRNQSVLLRGVNNSAETMGLLIKRLSYINVHPYYVYVHDMVKGVEDLRTSLAEALDIERAVRGITAGYNTPTFVVDLPGGGGKRDAHSYHVYNREYGISMWTAPGVVPNRVFTYYDPLHTLSEGVQRVYEVPHFIGQVQLEMRFNH